MTSFRPMRSQYHTSLDTIDQSELTNSIADAMTPFRPRGKRGYNESNIVKPQDVSTISKRKVDHEESVLCFPDEDNNSVLHKLTSTQLVSPPRKRTR